MAKYRKKPVEVEARRLLSRSWEVVAEWCCGKIIKDGHKKYCILIKTLEGEMEARPGDWIIKGVKGEFYPCKPDIFEQTYEKVI